MQKRSCLYYRVFKNTLTLLIVFLMLGYTSCRNGTSNTSGLGSNEKQQMVNYAPCVYEGVSDLRKGDILVKPNLNFLPGTAQHQGGWFFGHAAIVTIGAIHNNTDSLLAGAMIFESHASDVPVTHQLREVPGLVISPDKTLHNVSFAAKYRGSRYRLRLNIPENQIDSIIAFVREQKGDYSNWNAMKRFPDTPNISYSVATGERANWADNTHWYCSLLIWQAVLYVTGIDIDPNGGYYVYPNDMIVSAHFDNVDSIVGRARF